MIAPLAGIVSEFGDAISFIFTERESVSGGVRVGGLGQFGEFTANHLLLSLIALLAAIALSVPLGAYLGHIRKGEFLAISASNVGRAVPSLALLALFVAYLGIGFTVLAAVLLLLAIPPILTNTYVAVRQVDPEIVDAARGQGMTERQILSRVELPLSLPLIFGGIRTSAVAVVATATIGPFANVQSLGEPIINAQIFGDEGRLAAALVVAIITLLTDAGFGAIQRALTPRGLKVGAHQGSEPRGFSLPSFRRREAT